MKTINKSFTETLREACDTIVTLVRHAARRIERMPWPALLVMCLMLALFISVLPLALTLFVVFLLAKLVLGAFGVSHYHARRDPNETGK